MTVSPNMYLVEEISNRFIVYLLVQVLVQILVYSLYY
jgi:hypothetical protein